MSEEERNRLFMAAWVLERALIDPFAEEQDLARRIEAVRQEMAHVRHSLTTVH